MATAHRLLRLGGGGGDALGYVLVHPVYASATNFAKELPTLVRQAQHGKGQIGRLVNRLHLASYVKKNVPRLETLITGLGRPALAIGKTVSAASSPS